MSKLTYGQRKHLDTSSFAIPSERKYPIEDINHARNALARVSQFGNPSEKEHVRAKIFSAWPELAKRSKKD